MRSINVLSEEADSFLDPMNWIVVCWYFDFKQYIVISAVVKFLIGKNSIDRKFN